ncbi:MAG: hypothetical protein AAGC74_01940, partial [Verrucomicrobiota bacterium]
MKLFSLLLLLILPLAANPEDNFEFFSGTFFEDNGTTYAFLLRQSEDPTQLLRPCTVHFENTGTFTEVGTMTLQTRAAIIDDILTNVTTNFLEDQKDPLDETLNELFASILPNSLGLAEKLSGLLQVAQNDPAVLERIIFLSRTQPLLGLCLGTTFIHPIPAGDVSVFEFRSNGQPIGRVQLNTDQALTIPAPTNLTEVLEKDDQGNTLTQSPKNHLSAKFRWDTPDALARLTPLTYGYHLYRLEETFAEGNNWDATPPSPNEILTLVANNPEAVRVNEFPILTGNLTDAFILDNNNAFEGGSSFADGSNYYYYVAAADLIGRPGQLSQPLYVTIADRMPPSAPIKVRVENAFNSSDPTSTQRFKISWEPARNVALDPPTTYEIYRWDDVRSIHGHNGATGTKLNQVIILGDPTLRQRLSVTDNAGPSSPTFANDEGKTVWYTVRAIQATAAGNLSSGDSAPAYGVLRDRTGPPASSMTTLNLSQYCPQFTSFTTSNDPFSPSLADFFSGQQTSNTAAALAAIQRQSPEIKTATLSLCNIPGPGETPTIRLLATANFDDADAGIVYLGAHIPRDEWDDEALLLTITDSRGKSITSKQPLSYYETPGISNMRTFALTVDQIAFTKTITNNTGGGDRIHDPVITGGPNDGDLNPIQINFLFEEPAREFKLYKRIDGGPLLLVEQGTDNTFPVSPSVPITLNDVDLPANSAEICYFLQTFDRHGNPSPLTSLGCIQTSPRVNLVPPLITDITSASDNTNHLNPGNTTATISWFSPPDGVDAFYLYIADGFSRSPTDYGSSLTTPTINASVASNPPGNPTTSSVSVPGILIDGDFFQPYLTGRINGSLSNPADPGKYSLTIPVSPGRNYRFFIRPLAPTGQLGPRSQIRDYQWTTGNNPTPAEVPWPARTLPETL